MEEQAPQSSFSGQKYNPEQNTVTHYKAGKKKPGQSKSKTPKQKNGKATSCSVFKK